ncbi:hypothetical protein [Pseudonocardia sp. ICBG1293]|uniref:hypothetical protein n=1 Tax=Pseudonocardia sp. ICBG1293 TaxID=2844382 RepID=UPI001CCC435B|nr:hypothetical protein [Pseudonocardia sp. ICBG1293]
MPDASDTALLYLDRGLVRADDAPPDPAAQRRAHTLVRAARGARWVVPVAVLVVLVLAFTPVAGAAFWVAVLVVLVGVVASLLLLTRAAAVAHAGAGLPVPIEITGKVATAMRAVIAMTGALRVYPRAGGPAAEGVALLRQWTTATEALRAAWLRDDIGAWHDQARTLAAAGERATRITGDLTGGGAAPGAPEGNPGA